MYSRQREETLARESYHRGGFLGVGCKYADGRSANSFDSFTRTSLSTDSRAHAAKLRAETRVRTTLIDREGAGREGQMLWIRCNLEDCASRCFIRVAAVVALAMWALVSSRIAGAQLPGQKTFSSAKDASRALFVAVQKDDDRGLLDILGPDAKQLISSGDEIEDENNRSSFVEKYQQMHRLASGPDGATALYIGAENLPTPIPLVDKAGAWYFDTGAAREEILLRRIGQNELTIIQVCHQLVDAQKTYYAKSRGGDSVPHYAQRFVSDVGRHNGLFWLGTDDEFESPIDPLVANAGSKSGVAKMQRAGPIPFHGYYFRILKRQGENAPGGAAGDLLVAAWPARMEA
jgi:Protein of unknown function (DUF2950)